MITSLFGLRGLGVRAESCQAWKALLLTNRSCCGAGPIPFLFLLPHRWLIIFALWNWNTGARCYPNTSGNSKRCSFAVQELGGVGSSFSLPDEPHARNGEKNSATTLLFAFDITPSLRSNMKDFKVPE